MRHLPSAAAKPKPDTAAAVAAAVAAAAAKGAPALPPAAAARSSCPIPLLPEAPTEGVQVAAMKRKGETIKIP